MHRPWTPQSGSLTRCCNSLGNRFWSEGSDGVMRCGCVACQVEIRHPAGFRILGAIDGANLCMSTGMVRRYRLQGDAFHTSARISFRSEASELPQNRMRQDVGHRYTAWYKGNRKRYWRHMSQVVGQWRRPMFLRCAFDKKKARCTMGKDRVACTRRVTPA